MHTKIAKVRLLLRDQKFENMRTFFHPIAII